MSGPERGLKPSQFMQTLVKTIDVEWKYEGVDNLIFIFDKLTSNEINFLIDCIKSNAVKFSGSNEIEAGTLPFYDRGIALKCVKEEIEKLPAFMPEYVYNPFVRLRNLLDIDDYWINITTVESDVEVYINSVTNQKRWRPWLVLRWPTR